ncbi:acyltransferase [Vibrio anguillarum]|uniref:acyltransferase family protein n=1 Tax=Vibrio anguillarum TaxID=55601 RepID=UPI001D18F0E2|nr:acyltransferase [Vibrio anguillarum]MCC4238313.1 acyltransferase [Vibrio anguillarum]
MNNSIMSPGHLTYRSDIDGLRAIAVLLVVIYHAFPSYLPGGFVGVDIFFVISGFLITSIIVKDLEHGKFKFSDFYCRRINRIFPSLILVLVFSFIIGWFVYLPKEFEQLSKHILGGSFFVSNLVLLSESGYFDAAAESKPLLHPEGSPHNFPKAQPYLNRF